MRRSLLGLATGLVLAAVAPRSSAQTSSLDQPYPDGFSILRFEPAPAGDRFFAVPDATTSDAPERFRAMLLVHQTLAASIERTDNDTGATREVVSRQLYVHADGTFLVTPWLDANLDVPLALAQRGEGPAAPDAPALGDLRLSGRARFLGKEHAPLSLAGALSLWLPTGSEASLTGDGALRGEPKLIASGRARALVYSVSLGALLRKYVDTGSTEVGSSMTYGAAVGLSLVGDRLVLGPELYGSALLASERDTAFASASSPLEALFGLRGRFGAVVLGAAGGLGLSDAPGVAPRLVVSVAYAPNTPRPAPPPVAGAPHDIPPEVAPEPSNTDSVDLVDPADACPPVAGPPSANHEEDGCPDQHPPPPPAPGDEDEDGISDDKDACPHEAQSLAPGSPQSGCPGAGPAEAIFAGYRQGEGGLSTVFVELSDSVKVVVEKTKGASSYVMTGMKVALRNNQNPLLAMDFASNVKSARLVAEKSAVRLVIEFRTDVTPSYRVVRRGRGATLEVDVPAK